MLAASLCLVGLGSGCDRGQRATTQGPAPSASVVTIVAGLGYCEDRIVCERECEAGASDRCRRLGVSYEFGHGVDVDGAHATAMYEQACAMKNTDGCVAAGRMYEFHHGVAKDDVKATSFYSRACDLGDPTGCANFAIMLESGRGTERDIARARDYFARACTRGSSLACAHAKALRAPDARPD
jgi:TPR repeat protein